MRKPYFSFFLGQDYEICPYATFSLPLGSTEGNATTQPMDYTVQFQTFSQQDCYEGRPTKSILSTKEYYGRSRSGKTSSQISSRLCTPAIELKTKRSSKSPPDGLSLEVSCISSQQTLPISSHRYNFIKN